MKVCIASVNVLRQPEAGGHAWVYLNWALGLQSNGFDVFWMENLPPDVNAAEARKRISVLKHQMSAIGLRAQIAWLGSPEPDLTDIAVSWEAAAEQSDLLMNFNYHLPPSVVRRFRRSALVDIDPGLLQTWVRDSGLRVAPHDINFTIGETVGRPEALFPDCGMRWHYTRSPIHLPSWPVSAPGPEAVYTTVTDWWGAWDTFQGEAFSNAKRDTFLQFSDLASLASAPLELAVCFGDTVKDAVDQRLLEKKGWRIRHAWDITGTPPDYRRYIQGSRGEFSCAKPSCMRFANAWISDRTLCYLASGKPAIVQHTGTSRFLPDCEGLFRFRTMDEAVCALSMAETEYERHCRAARTLAEEFFDAKKVAGSVIERALS
jgi:hypothetical protein